MLRESSRQAWCATFAALLAYSYFSIVVSERALRSYRALGPLFLGTLGWFGGFDPCARPQEVRAAVGAADRLRTWRKRLQKQTRTLVEEMMPKLGIKDRHRIIPHARLRSNSQLAADLAAAAAGKGRAGVLSLRSEFEGWESMWVDDDAEIDAQVGGFAAAAHAQQQQARRR